MRTIATIRNLRIEISRKEMAEDMARRVPLTPEQIEAGRTKAQVYPPGSRFE